MLIASGIPCRLDSPPVCLIRRSGKVQRSPTALDSPAHPPPESAPVAGPRPFPCGKSVRVRSPVSVIAGAFPAVRLASPRSPPRPRIPVALPSGLAPEASFPLPILAPDHISERVRRGRSQGNHAGNHCQTTDPMEQLDFDQESADNVSVRAQFSFLRGGRLVVCGQIRPALATRTHPASVLVALT